MKDSHSLRGSTTATTAVKGNWAMTLAATSSSGECTNGRLAGANPEK